MIPRHSRPAMAALRTPGARLHIWFEVVALADPGVSRGGGGVAVMGHDRLVVAPPGRSSLRAKG